MAVLLALAAVFAVLIVPIVILSQPLIDRDIEIPGGQVFDEVHFHMPVVRVMVSEWPAVDIVNYRSATSPGYHLVLAGIRVVFGASELSLRLVHAGLSLVLVLVAAWPVARMTGPLFAFACGMVVLTSSYIFGASAFLTTDNAALLFVSAALLPCVFGRAPRAGEGAGWRAPGVGLLLLAGLMATAAVGVRQVHVWLAAPIGVAGLVASGLVWTPAWLRRAEGGESPSRARFIAGCLAAAAPMALLGWFVLIWGGLMPPAYRHIHGAGFNFAQPPLALGAIGLLGVFLIPAASGVLRTPRRLVRPVLIGGAMGLASAKLSPTSFDPEAGRQFGWMWQLVQRTPAVADRSLLLLALAPLGGAVLGVFWLAARDRGRATHATMVLLALVSWSAAHSANSQAWYRYVEPMILVALVWLAVLAWAPVPGEPERETKRARVAAVLGPAALAFVMLGMSGMKFIKPLVELRLSEAATAKPAVTAPAPAEQAAPGAVTPR